MAGIVKSGQTITAVFTTSSPTTGAATNADSLPTGQLYINGTANGAAVTITNIDTGRYKAALTLPALSAGDVVDVSIAATIGTVAGKGVVWSAVADTRRVSDLNDAPTVSATAIRSEMDANSTKLANLDATVSSRLPTSGYTAPSTPPTASQNAAAVWGEALPGSYTSGQAGYKLNAAGSAADPLLNPVPGSYPSGSAGAALGRIGAASVTVVSPVATTGTINFYLGDDYAATEARSIDFFNVTGNWFDLSLTTPKLYFYRNNKELFNVSGTVINPTGPNQQVRFDVLNAQTSLLRIGDPDCTYKMKIIVTSNQHLNTEVKGKVVVN